MLYKQVVLGEGPGFTRTNFPMRYYTQQSIINRSTLIASQCNAICPHANRGQKVIVTSFEAAHWINVSTTMQRL